MMPITDVEPPEEVEALARQSFAELGVLGVDGTKVAEKVHRVYHAPRSFEQPTETFARKTGMRDKGPPGYEYNDTAHLSVSAVVKKGAPGSAVFLAASDNRGSDALPGVRVRAYPTTPTRDDRLEAAESAAHARAEEARKRAIKSRRDRKILLATAAEKSSCGHRDKPVSTSSEPASGLATTVIRQPRSRFLEDRARREALEAKAQAIAASPREGKAEVGKPRRGGNRTKLKRGPATAEKAGMYHGIKVPLDAFAKPFAGGSALDALPGRLESLLFPQRYVDWPSENAALPALALDVKSSPVRHAVAFRSKQPRIVCYDPQRETRGWDGPGAYEWDDRPPEDDTHTATAATTPPAEAGDTEGSGEAAGMSGGDGGGGGGGGGSGGGGSAMGTRPRGISVRDPDRPSPAFREGSFGFVPPTQTNVRGFAPSPSTGSAPDSSAGGGGGGGSAAAGNKNQGGRRRKPRRHWMFQTPGKQVRPALATENWDGPGAYAIGIETGVRVKEPARRSPAFLEGSGGKRGREADRRGRENWIRSPRPSPSPGGHPEAFPITPSDGGRESPGTPDILANWSSPHLEFTPPEPKTVAHALRRQGPNRFVACFLSVTERFGPDTPFGFSPATTPSGLGPGAGESSNGGDIAGPVERYDLVSSRQQPPAANTWLGTSIRPGLPYNPSFKADDTGGAAATHHRDQHHHHRPSSSFSPLSPPHLVREDAATGNGTAGTAGTTGDARETPTSERNPATMSGGGGGAGRRRRDNNSPDLAPLALAAVGKRVRSTPGWVLSLPPSSAAAAVAAAGLARSWAGRGVDGDGGAGGGGNGFRAERDVGITGDGGGGGGGGDGGGDEGTRGADGGGGGGQKGSGADREGEPRSACIGTAVSEEKGSGRGTTARPCQPGESEPFSAAVAAGKNLAVSEDRRVTAAVNFAQTHRQQRRGNKTSSYRLKHQPFTASAITAGDRSFTPSGGVPNPGSSAITNKVAASAPVDAAMTEERLAAADLSMTAAAVAAAAERERGLIRTVGRPKRGPCMFTPATSGEISRRASSTRTELLRKTGSSGSGSDSSSSSGANRSGPGPRPLWEAEATGGLLGPGETKVLVC